MRGTSAVIALAAFAALAPGANVLVLTTSDLTIDSQWVASLMASGHTVTIGQAWGEFDGSDPLAGIDVVVLTGSFNWNSWSDMPSAGQTALVDYVANGGGLITTEWTMWRGGDAVSSFAILEPVLPSEPTGYVFRTVSPVTYTIALADPVMNAGLPSSITFDPDSFSGTESLLVPKPGAIGFFSSDFVSGSVQGYGVVGWDYFAGRSVNISTCVGTLQLAHSDFSQLLSNAVEWAAGGVAGCPADLTGEGDVNTNDFFRFLAYYQAQDPRADFSPGGGINTNDFFAFLAAYQAGC